MKNGLADNKIQELYLQSLFHEKNEDCVLLDRNKFSQLCADNFLKIVASPNISYIRITDSGLYDIEDIITTQFLQSSLEHQFIRDYNDGILDDDLYCILETDKESLNKFYKELDSIFKKEPITIPFVDKEDDCIPIYGFYLPRNKINNSHFVSFKSLETLFNNIKINVKIPVKDQEHIKIETLNPDDLNLTVQNCICTDYFKLLKFILEKDEQKEIDDTEIESLEIE